MVKTADMNKAELLAALKTARKSKSGKSGHNTGHRKKMSRQQRLLSGLGIFPFAPLKLARGASALNAVSSVVLGKDLENGFTGQASINRAELITGKVRGDIPGIWRNAGLTGAQKLKATVLAMTWHAQSTITTVAGARRAILPVVVTEISFQVAKGFKANSFIPPEVRRFVRFT